MNYPCPNASKNTFLSSSLLLILACGVLISVCTSTAPASACCNAIPVAQRNFPYPSNTGGIAGPIATVTKTRVVLTANIGNCSSTTLPFFNADPLKHKIDLVFRDIGRGGKEEPDVDITKVDAAVVCNPDCNTFSFKMPDLTDASKPGLDRGAAGPAVLTVTDLDTGDVIVEIDDLFQTTDGCNRFPEEVFTKFTVVPKPNVFHDGTFPDGLRAARDEHGNLLVPLDYTDQTQPLGGAPFAVLLRGTSQETHDGADGSEKLLPKLANAGGGGRSRFVRSFTHDGRPMPPLLRMTDAGELFGLANVDVAVLRIARTKDWTSSPGPPLFTVKGRIHKKRGPVRLKKEHVGKQNHDLTLISLRSSEMTVAYTRDEDHEQRDVNKDGNVAGLVPIVLNVDDGVIHNTKGTATKFPVGALEGPELDVAGVHVAFLEPDPSPKQRVRVFDRQGVDETGTSAPSDVDVVKHIAPRRQQYQEGRRIAVVGSLTVFRKNGVAKFFDPATGTVKVGPQAAASAIAPGKRAVVLTSESEVKEDLNADGDEKDHVAQFWDLEKNCVVNLGLAASLPVSKAGIATRDHIAISKRIIVVAVSEKDQGDQDRNGDGDETDAVVAVVRVADADAVCGTPDPAPPTHTNIGVVADAVGAWRRTAIFITPEAGEKPGYDLNGDTDDDDRVLQAFTLGDGKPENIGWAAEDFVIAEEFVAFRTPEPSENEKSKCLETSPSANECDLNMDGDALDHVMQVYVPESVGEDGGVPCVERVVNSRRSARLCNQPKCDPRFPYKPIRTSVWFITNEAEDDRDLNGDEKIEDILVLSHARVARCTFLAVTGAVPFTPDAQLPPFPEKFIDTPVLFAAVSRDSAGVPAQAPTGGSVLGLAGDSDGDDVFDPFDNCTENRNPDQIDADADGLGDAVCDEDSSACPDVPIDECEETEPRGVGFLWEGGVLTWSRTVPEREALTAFSDPIRKLPHYSVCVYDSKPKAVLEAAVLSTAICGKRSCWTEEEGGFRYENRVAGRVREFAIRPGDAGRVEVDVKAVSSEPAGRETWTVQLVLNENNNEKDRRCWESRETSAAVK